MQFRKYRKLAAGITAAALLVLSGGSVFAETNFDKHREMYRLRSTGNYLECITLADSMLAENPYDMSSYTNKALAAYQYWDPATSFDTFEKQLSINPYNKTALYNKACLASVITDYNTVIETIRLLLDMDISIKKNIMKDSDFKNCYENEYIINMLFNPSIRVCGTVLDPSVPPINENGRLLVPVRPVIEAMGAAVDWNPNDNSFAVIMDDKNLIMQIGSNTAKLNGVPMNIETAPVLKDERTYVPVRFIAETMGFDVEWDADQGLADIYTKIPEGDLSLDKFSADNSFGIDSLPICGYYIEPYMLDAEKGLLMLVINNNTILDEFNALSVSDKIVYLKHMVLENSALLTESGCLTADVQLIYGNNVVYSMNYDFISGECGKLKYFKNGLLTNVVKQLTAEDNYVDYYLLKSIQTDTAE